MFIWSSTCYATMYQNFIIPYLYEAQHVWGDTPPIIRSLKLHWQPLVFHTWKVVGSVVVGRCQAHCAWQRPPTTRLTTFHLWKTRGCQCTFRLLMMGDVSPETCWASYKYGIIKFWYIVASCWIFLYGSYYDARTHELQIYNSTVVYFRNTGRRTTPISVNLTHACHAAVLYCPAKAYC